jgi:hypothetical protein
MHLKYGMALEIVQLLQRVLTIKIAGYVDRREIERARTAMLNVIQQWKGCREPAGGLPPIGGCDYEKI